MELNRKVSIGVRKIREINECVRRVPGVPAAAFLAGLLFLFQPAQVYKGNEPYYFYGFVQLSLLLVAFFMLAFALLAAVAMIGGPRWRQATAATLTGIGLASWVNATFFSKIAGQLDGRHQLELSADSLVQLSTALYVFVFLVGVALANRQPAQTRRFLSAMFLVLAAFTGWVTASDSNPWRAAPAPERLATFSTERNVLVILLDAFQSDFFVDILAKEPRTAQSLEGFTFLANATGSALTTYLAMPTIHSGVPVRDGRGLQGLYQAEVIEGSFVARLSRSGYDAMVVNAVLGKCPIGALCDHADQLVHGQAAPMLEASMFLVNLAAFRLAPHVVRPAIYRQGAWWTPWKLFSEFARTSNGVLELLAREVKGGSRAPTVRFLHLMSSHGPASFNADCLPVEGLPWTRESAIAQDECALSKVSALLESLRARRLYDQTAIIVLADHGSGMPKDEASGFLLGAGASPLLLVKPFGARGPMRTSTRVVGLGDVAATVCAWTGDCRASHGADVLDPEERQAAYPFVTYVWEAHFLGADEVPFDNYFEVRGPPSRVSSWWRATNLPAKGLTRLDFSGDDPVGAYGFGWSGFELYGGKYMRWAVGPEADVYLPLDASSDQQLDLDVKTHPGNLVQKMVVEVNGSKVAELTVGDSWAVHEVRVPKEVIGQGPGRVLFRFLHSNSPDPGDPRRLGVLFRSLTVRPAP